MPTTRARLLALVCGALAPLAGCNDPQLEGVEVESEMTVIIVDPVPIRSKDVDILFVVDNSGSMAEEQAALAASVGSLIDVLERPGVDANYRIGVTTTDNGNPWCGNTSPEAGLLQMSSCHSRLESFTFEGATTIDAQQEACLDLCPDQWADIETLPTAVDSSSDTRPRPWLERIDGATNLPKGLTTTQAFQCVGPQGIDGCGFESPLESMWKAVRRSQTDDDPGHGFMRNHAVLSIVHVTDEADCSYNSAQESMFLPDGNRVFWSDPEAASPTSAACWNAGVRCEGSGTYDDCQPIDRGLDGNEVSAADADELAALRPMSRYVEILQTLEDQKQQIFPNHEVLVSIIGGVTSDGSVVYQDAIDDPQFQIDFGIGPGCEGPNGRAVPPVRLRELARHFEVEGDRNLFSSCDGDYSFALEAIAEAIADQLEPNCVPACVADTDADTPDVLDPACTVTQEWVTDDGELLELEVPECEPEHTLPDGADVCYLAASGDELHERCMEQGFNLELQFVRRDGVPRPKNPAISAKCELSDDRARDCPGLP
ncbi:VWA domain-containing protein [Paraliomyxa miuraensis]|uniref:VWA domain-containing protein n=1 Tax=Paraliomyxa miuraensis TaxID=376150 RepID=UPI00225A07B8|nr:VWA domain-containing protein [Paraliomyxa miuraensis]MCX4247816.1 VWA domain-containing protein [Paraliomyxa miuraensis]